MSEKLTRKYSEIVGTTFVGGEWQDHDLLSVIGDLESELAQAQADVEALRPLRDSLLEIRELLGPDSGYHISPDKAPEGLGELMRIGAIFERADSALAALLEHLRGASK